MTRDELATRLRKAPEGSRELSDLVLLWAGWRRNLSPMLETDEWFRPDGFVARAPDPTRRIDDIVVAMDWANIVGSIFRTPFEAPSPWEAFQLTEGRDDLIVEHGHTECLARCIAAVMGDPR